MVARVLRDAAAPVEVQTFGAFAVYVGGERLSAREQAQRKPLALLKVLIACGPEGVAIDRLTDVLWQELEGDRARQAYAVALHRLRRILGPKVLHSSGGTAWLDPSNCRLDVAEFEACVMEAEALLAAGGPTTAVRALGERLVAIYPGPFLEGDFSYPEILSARSLYHGRFLSTLDALAGRLGETGALDDAIVLYRRGLDVDGLAEEFCLALMNCLHRAGRNTEAVQAYRRCVESLRLTLGSEPSPALRNALAHLEDSGKPPEHTPYAPPRPVPPTTASPIVWRRMPPMTRRRLLWATGLAGLALTPAMAVPQLRAMLQDDEADPAALLEQDGFPRYRAPSLAVLPAMGTGSGTTKALAADSGLTDLGNRLTTALAILPDIRVAAYRTVRATQNPHLSARALAAALGVEYLAEPGVSVRDGLVQIRLRVVAGNNESNVWAHTFSVGLSHYQQQPDEVVLRMARALAARLAYGPREFLGSESLLNDAPSWERIVDAALAHHPDPRTQALRRIASYEALLGKHPDSHVLLAALAMAQTDLARHRWTAMPMLAWNEAYTLATRANALDPRHARGSAVLAYYYSHHYDYEKAAKEIELFISTYPEDPMNHRMHAEVLMYLGRLEESLAAIRYAASLWPAYPAHLFTILELDYYLTGRYDLSVAASTVALARSARRQRSWVTLTAAEAARGNAQVARAAAQGLLRVRPKFSAEGYARWVFRPMRNKEPLVDFRDRLISAGLPD